MAYNIVKLGEIFGTGSDAISVETNMFLDNSTYLEPANVRIPVAGTFINCSRGGNTQVTLNNPASDTTCQFPVEWSMPIDELHYYSTDITVILYHSLGLYNITMTLIKNAIGETMFNLSSLCKSSKVNHYAQYCPDGSIPYKMGDFRKYAHNTPGGTSTTAIYPLTSIAWKGPYTVRGLGSKIFKQITSQPWAQTKLQIKSGATLKSESDDVSLGTGVYGIYDDYSANNTYDISTNETWTVRTQHNLGGSYVDGSIFTFIISFTGDPYQVVVTNQVHIVDTLDITYTSLTPTRGRTMKLTVANPNGGYSIQTNSTSPETIEYDGPGPLSNGAAWNLQLDTIESGYVQVAAGTIP
jgi:hypothetical protein